MSSDQHPMTPLQARIRARGALIRDAVMSKMVTDADGLIQFPPESEAALYRDLADILSKPDKGENPLEAIRYALRLAKALNDPTIRYEMIDELKRVVLFGE